jgi:ribonuclease R
LQIEGLVHVSSLGSEYFSRDMVHRRLTGERSGRSWQLADTVKVRVIRADLEQKKIDFELADAGPRGEDGGRRDRPRRRRARR